MLHRPRDARVENIYRVAGQVAPGRTLVGAGDLFVEALQRVIERRPVELFGYVVLERGYRLLVRALDDRLAPALRDLQSHLARGINRREGCSGALWAGRVDYRSMRRQPEAGSTLVDLLVEPVLSGAASHPARHRLPTSYGALVEGRGDGVAHTALPWFGAADAAAMARRLDEAVQLRLRAAERWSLADVPVAPPATVRPLRRRGAPPALRLVG